MAAGKSLQLQLLLIIWVLCTLSMSNFSQESGYGTIRCIESERQALLNFKKDVEDPFDLLSSWTTAEQDCCRWTGVGCDNDTGHVVMLLLSSWKPMSGRISSSLLELPYLSHLDFSSNNFERIPYFFGSLSNLTYLDMSGNRINGTFPYQLGNLSMLQYLDLSRNDEMRADSIEWLNRLSSLEVLRLSSVNFGKSVDWLKSIKIHPSLSTLDLSYFRFPEINTSSLSLVDSSSSLTAIYLFESTFNSSIYSWLFNLSTAIVDLGITGCELTGPISDSFGDLKSLVRLRLSGNQLEGGIQTSFRDLCHLKALDISSNNLSVSFSSILENLSCAKNSLEILRLGDNQLIGSIPDFTEFSSLRELHIYENHLDGSFPESFKHFSKLRVLTLESNHLVGSLPKFSKFPSLILLYLANNEFNGVLTEAHFLNLSNLQLLDLSHNPNLTLNFSPEWSPSFQLDTIKLRSCKLGQQFPKWIRSQKSFSYLDISNSEISDAIPSWFWNLPSKLEYLNLSVNHISGEVSDISLQFYISPAVDLSNNLFYGPIPRFLSNVSVLNLSKNMFTGSLSFLCKVMQSAFSYINLSDNLLSGSLPDCWVQFKQLKILNLENNGLSGRIPSSIGLLSGISTLHLRNNNFTGGLPSSLKNCSELKLLDLGENKLTGKLSEWLGESLRNLMVLRLRSNRFYGSLPSTICSLSSIQILDVAFNNLSGNIPSCLNNLTAMTQTKSLNGTIPYIFLYSCHSSDLSYCSLGYWGEYNDYASVVWRRIEQEYNKTLGLLKIIDFSSNTLSGEIPEQVTSLLGIISLNLSRNNLIGTLPSGIGQLKMLESLDLSHNQLSGKIPGSLSDISFLNTLDLSSNQLTGRIPKGTQLQSFSATAYWNNSGLCGPPLAKCPGAGTKQDQPRTGGTVNNNEEGLTWSWFYAGVAPGFVVGLLGFCGSLMMSSSWRYSYFGFLNKVTEWLFSQKRH